MIIIDAHDHRSWPHLAWRQQTTRATYVADMLVSEALAWRQQAARETDVAEMLASEALEHRLRVKMLTIAAFAEIPAPRQDPPGSPPRTAPRGSRRLAAASGSFKKHNAEARGLYLRKLHRLLLKELQHMHFEGC